MFKESIIFPPKNIIQIIHSCHMDTTEPISITHVALTHNPAPFLSKIPFTFTFLSQQPLVAPLHWKIIYVGSARDESYDQVLEEFEIEEAEVGVPCKFQVECPPPDWKKIPPAELLSLTAIIITVSYKGQEFVRIGYYVHMLASVSQERRKECPPQQLVQQLTRTILIDKPRITKFKINLTNKQKESSAKKHHHENTPVKSEKGDRSNSMLSVSKTSCNGESYHTDLPLPSLFCKKEKKIKKPFTKPIH